MKNNSLTIDPLMVSTAQLELFRLSREHHCEVINLENVRMFREMLTILCNNPQSEKMTAMLEEVIKEFCFGQPCREEEIEIKRVYKLDSTEVRNLKTFEILKGILLQFDSLLQDSSKHALALRLHEFCYIFSKHFNGKNEREYFSEIRGPSEIEIPA